MSDVISFGSAPSGQDTHLYLLRSAGGAVVGVTDLGTSLVLCHVPDGRGNFPDVTLGHAGAAGYVGDGYNLGAIVGRSANRIAGARFEIAGTSHQLTANSGAHSLHSGPEKWSERLWQVSALSDDSVSFTFDSPAGDQGYPGSVQVQLSYRISADNQLTITARAVPSEPTIINLTTHAYWNLNGHAAGSVLDHTVQLDATHYTPLEDHLPTGERAPVAGTPYDFREPRALGACTDVLPGGYDDNFCLSDDGRLRHAARLTGDMTGITMDVLTTAPGIQMYTADYFGVDWAKGGAHYGGFAGVALEPQFYPDAIHHPAFAQPVFTPEKPFTWETVFAFGTST